MKTPKAAIIGEVLQVRKGRRRIELVIAPQDTRPEVKSEARTHVYDEDELTLEQIEKLEQEGLFVEPAWSFYVSRSVFEALGRPTVGSEIMVTLSQIK